MHVEKHINEKNKQTSYWHNCSHYQRSHGFNYTPAICYLLLYQKNKKKRRRKPQTSLEEEMKCKDECGV